MSAGLRPGGWLTRPAGRVSAAGFYGQGISGLITDLGDGQVMLDEDAMAALRGLPPDRDGHVSDENELSLFIGGARYPLAAEPSTSGPGL
jgi:hypothetical protein